MVYFSPVCSGMLLIISESSGSMIASVRTLVFSTCCAQFNIIATVVMDTSFGQHGVILYFRFPLGIKKKKANKHHTNWHRLNVTSLISSNVVRPSNSKPFILLKNIFIIQHQPSFGSSTVYICAHGKKEGTE